MSDKCWCGHSRRSHVRPPCQGLVNEREVLARETAELRQHVDNVMEAMGIAMREDTLDLLAELT